MRITGFHTDGGFAEYVLAPVSSLIPVPYRISDEIACLAEPLACAINALDQAGVENDQSILIYGAGPLGLLMGMAAAWRGADPYITETSTEKFIKSEDFRAKIGIGTAVSGTSGFDAAINAAPFAGTFMEGLTRLKYGGNFCLFSGLTGNEAITAEILNEIHYRQLKVSGAYGCTRPQMKQALNILAKQCEEAGLLIEGRIDFDAVPGILSHVLSGKPLKYIARINQ